MMFSRTTGPGPEHPGAMAYSPEKATHDARNGGETPEGNLALRRGPGCQLALVDGGP